MAKKVVLIVVGIILLLCGLGALVPGVVLTAATGSDNALESGYHTVGTATPALVSQTERISDASAMGRSGFGTTTITIAARSNQPVFLGIAQASDVDQFLDGVAYDEVRDFELSPFRVDTVRRSGLSVAQSPASENFWVASATGTAPEIEWEISDGDYRVVVMNDDGSPGVQAEAQFGIAIQGLFGIGLGTLIVGALVALLGLVLLILGIRTRSQPAPAMTAGGPPPSAPYPPSGGGYPPPPPPPTTPPSGYQPPPPPDAPSGGSQPQP